MPGREPGETRCHGLGLSQPTKKWQRTSAEEGVSEREPGETRVLF